MNFNDLIDRFEQAVASRDGEGLAALFTTDGCYDDGFFGEHHGRPAIAEMLERFYVGGEDFFWQFSERLQAGNLGYAHYAFSYRSREPESAGQTILFEGMARFRLRDGLIEHYAEVFDRGVAFVQLGYETPRVRKLLDRYAAGGRSRPIAAEHLAARAARALKAG